MLNPEIQKRLKSLPKTRCHDCQSLNSYGNRLSKCYACKRKFCPSDLTCGQTFPSMKETDEYVDYCDVCLLRLHPT